MREQTYRKRQRRDRADIEKVKVDGERAEQRWRVNKAKDGGER